MKITNRIFKTIYLESSKPWQSLLPNCLCKNNRLRIILYEQHVYCGCCGKAFGVASCVGLCLTREELLDITFEETNCGKTNPDK